MINCLIIWRIFGIFWITYTILFVGDYSGKYPIGAWVDLPSGMLLGDLIYIIGPI